MPDHTTSAVHQQQLKELHGRRGAPVAVALAPPSFLSVCVSVRVSVSLPPSFPPSLPVGRESLYWILRKPKNMATFTAGARSPPPSRRAAAAAAAVVCLAAHAISGRVDVIPSLERAR